MEDAFATWHLSIILISLRVEVAQISDYLIHAKILPLLKAFFSINLPYSILGKKDIVLLQRKDSYKDIAKMFEIAR